MIFVGVIVADGPRAVLFLDHFWENPHWMPKSQISIHRYPDTFEVTMVASPFICRAKHMNEFSNVEPVSDERG